MFGSSSTASSSTGGLPPASELLSPPTNGSSFNRNAAPTSPQMAPPSPYIGTPGPYHSLTEPGTPAFLNPASVGEQAASPSYESMSPASFNNHSGGSTKPSTPMGSEASPAPYNQYPNVQYYPPQYSSGRLPPAESLPPASNYPPRQLNYQKKPGNDSTLRQQLSRPVIKPIDKRRHTISTQRPLPPLAQPQSVPPPTDHQPYYPSGGPKSVPNNFDPDQPEFRQEFADEYEGQNEFDQYLSPAPFYPESPMPEGSYQQLETYPAEGYSEYQDYPQDQFYDPQGNYIGSEMGYVNSAPPYDPTYPRGPQQVIYHSTGPNGQPHTVVHTMVDPQNYEKPPEPKPAPKKSKKKTEPPNGEPKPKPKRVRKSAAQLRAEKAAKEAAAKEQQAQAPNPTSQLLSAPGERIQIHNGQITRHMPLQPEGQEVYGTQELEAENLDDSASLMPPPKVDTAPSVLAAKAAAAGPSSTGSPGYGQGGQGQQVYGSEKLGNAAQSRSSKGQVYGKEGQGYSGQQVHGNGQSGGLGLARSADGQQVYRSGQVASFGQQGHGGQGHGGQRSLETQRDIASNRSHEGQKVYGAGQQSYHGSSSGPATPSLSYASNPGTPNFSGPHSAGYNGPNGDGREGVRVGHNGPHSAGYAGPGSAGPTTPGSDPGTPGNYVNQASEAVRSTSGARGDGNVRTNAQNQAQEARSQGHEVRSQGQEPRSLNQAQDIRSQGHDTKVLQNYGPPGSVSALPARNTAPLTSTVRLGRQTQDTYSVVPVAYSVPAGSVQTGPTYAGGHNAPTAGSAQVTGPHGSGYHTVSSAEDYGAHGEKRGYRGQDEERGYRAQGEEGGYRGEGGAYGNTDEGYRASEDYKESYKPLVRRVLVQQKGSERRVLEYDVDRHGEYRVARGQESRMIQDRDGNGSVRIQNPARSQGSYNGEGRNVRENSGAPRSLRDDREGRDDREANGAPAVPRYVPDQKAAREEENDYRIARDIPHEHTIPSVNGQYLEMRRPSIHLQDPYDDFDPENDNFLEDYDEYGTQYTEADYGSGEYEQKEEKGIQKTEEGQYGTEKREFGDKEYGRDEKEQKEYGREEVEGRDYDRERSGSQDYGREGVEVREYGREGNDRREYGRDEREAREYNREVSEAREYGREPGDNRAYDRERSASQDYGNYSNQRAEVREYGNIRNDRRPYVIQKADGREYVVQKSDGREFMIQKDSRDNTKADPREYIVQKADGREYLVQKADGREYVIQKPDGREYIIQKPDSKDYMIQKFEAREYGSEGRNSQSTGTPGSITPSSARDEAHLNDEFFTEPEKKPPPKRIRTAAHRAEVQRQKYLKQREFEMKQARENHQYLVRYMQLRKMVRALVFTNTALSDEVSRVKTQIDVVTEQRKVIAKEVRHCERKRIRRMQTHERKAKALKAKLVAAEVSGLHNTPYQMEADSSTNNSYASYLDTKYQGYKQEMISPGGNFKQHDQYREGYQRANEGYHRGGEGYHRASEPYHNEAFRRGSTGNGFNFQYDEYDYQYPRNEFMDDAIYGRYDRFDRQPQVKSKATKDKGFQDDKKQEPAKKLKKKPQPRKRPNQDQPVDLPPQPKKKLKKLQPLKVDTTLTPTYTSKSLMSPHDQIFVSPHRNRPVDPDSPQNLNNWPTDQIFLSPTELEPSPDEKVLQNFIPMDGKSREKAETAEKERENAEKRDDTEKITPEGGRTRFSARLQRQHQGGAGSRSQVSPREASSSHTSNVINPASLQVKECKIEVSKTEVAQVVGNKQQQLVKSEGKATQKGTELKSGAATGTGILSGTTGTILPSGTTGTILTSGTVGTKTGAITTVGTKIDAIGTILMSGTTGTKSGSTGTTGPNMGTTGTKTPSEAQEGKVRRGSIGNQAKMSQGGTIGTMSVQSSTGNAKAGPPITSAGKIGQSGTTGKTSHSGTGGSKAGLSGNAGAKSGISGTSGANVGHLGTISGKSGQSGTSGNISGLSSTSTDYSGPSVATGLKIDSTGTEKLKLENDVSKPMPSQPKSRKNGPIAIQSVPKEPTQYQPKDRPIPSPIKLYPCPDELKDTRFDAQEPTESTLDKYDEDRSYKSTPTQVESPVPFPEPKRRTSSRQSRRTTRQSNTPNSLTESPSTSSCTSPIPVGEGTMVTRRKAAEAAMATPTMTTRSKRKLQAS
ncbi:unnamed protein product [Bursaphelenchus okinawaensis]|uniref:Uncharacterized protein n=1 Tax=Bursaphelenchus okinawaensis TaxID=465554 RepID=A0A811LDS9_9BILA|nr:unnamed protein product [Bursaphelenchus okinawaensis]CAG9122028.1 unnamed protein product [Bursaphelenchus okinawaensis]